MGKERDGLIFPATYFVQRCKRCGMPDVDQKGHIGCPGDRNNFATQMPHTQRTEARFDPTNPEMYQGPY